MTFNTGTATDYIDMLDQLIEVVTGRHMATIAMVSGGGSTYVAGDILTIDATGATFTETAQIEVLTVSAGVILTSRIYRGGVYTVDPTSISPSSVTGGGGTGATFTLTFDDTGWTQLARETVAVSATVTVGGTGYTDGSTDVLTVVGGVLATGGTAATFTATVASGIVTSVALLSAGDYEVFPDSPVLTSVLPTGGDNACTLTVTTADKSDDTVVVLQGDAGSAIAPLVGIKTYSSETDETGANSVFNWLLVGLTDWSETLALYNQSNVSPGFSSAADGNITTVATGDGAFLPLHDNTAPADMQWTIRATGRSVSLIVRVQGSSTVHYAQTSFGLLNQFGVTTELPFPAYVVASSDRKRVWYADTSAIFSGIATVISLDNGPMFVWAPEGSWIPAKNGRITSAQATTPAYATGNLDDRMQVWPVGDSNANTGDDIIWLVAGTEGFDNGDFALSTNAFQIYRTPDTGGDLFPLYPVTIVQSDSSSEFYRTMGAIDGIWWFSDNDAGVSSEDRFAQGLVLHTIFQNGTQTEPYNFLAIEEN